MLHFCYCQLVKLTRFGFCDATLFQIWSAWTMHQAEIESDRTVAGSLLGNKHCGATVGSWCLQVKPPSFFWIRFVNEFGNNSWNPMEPCCFGSSWRKVFSIGNRAPFCRNLVRNAATFVRRCEGNNWPFNLQFATYSLQCGKPLLLNLVEEVIFWFFSHECFRERNNQELHFWSKNT